MRIAISGSHRVGKTSLAEALVQVLPGHTYLEEPYDQLEEQGHEFAAEPSLEDFELQLESSLHSLETAGPQVVFDRCPLDLLGYLLTHEDADAFYIEDWLPRVREALGTLDVVVFVPVEDPDVVAVPRAELEWRAEVDMVLQDIVLADGYGMEHAVLEVRGALSERLSLVQQYLASLN